MASGHNICISKTTTHLVNIFCCFTKEAGRVGGARVTLPALKSYHKQKHSTHMEVLLLQGAYRETQKEAGQTE